MGASAAAAAVYTTTGCIQNNYLILIFFCLMMKREPPMDRTMAHIWRRPFVLCFVCVWASSSHPVMCTAWIYTNWVMATGWCCWLVTDFFLEETTIVNVQKKEEENNKEEEICFQFPFFFTRFCLFGHQSYRLYEKGHPRMDRRWAATETSLLRWVSQILSLRHVSGCWVDRWNWKNVIII